MVTGYMVNGQKVEGYPIKAIGEHNVVPILEELPGFDKKEVTQARTFDELPENAQKFVIRLCEIIGVRPYAIGVGPGRDEVIEMHNPFTGMSVYWRETT